MSVRLLAPIFFVLGLGAFLSGGASCDAGAEGFGVAQIFCGGFLLLASFVTLGFWTLDE